MEDFIGDYDDEEDDGITQYNKRRGGIGRSNKEGGFNEALEKSLET